MRWNTATGIASSFYVSEWIKASSAGPQIGTANNPIDKGECELYLDVDCSGLSYESRPSASVLAAVEDLKRQQQLSTTSSIQQEFGRTESYQESLSTSLLSRLDGKSISEAELTEAFCRDVNTFDHQVTNAILQGRRFFQL